MGLTWDDIKGYASKAYTNFDTAVGGILPGGQDSIFDTDSDFWYGEGSMYHDVVVAPEEQQAAIEQQQEDIISGGIKGLRSEYEKFLGDEGILQRGRDIREQSLYDKFRLGKKGTLQTFESGKSNLLNLYQQNLDKIGASTRSTIGQGLSAYRNIYGKSGLATSGTAEQLKERTSRAAYDRYQTSNIKAGELKDLKLSDLMAKKDLDLESLQSSYDTGMASSELTFDTESARLLSKISKDLNKMLTDYTIATGEVYDTTPALDSLNNLLYGEEQSVGGV